MRYPVQRSLNRARARCFLRGGSGAGLAVALAAQLWVHAARAGDAVAAEALFREGRALMEAGNYAAACPKLAESNQQDEATGTLLALGVCEEKLGHIATAWATFAAAAARASREGRTDRLEAALERQAALEPRLSRLILSVDESNLQTPGLVVERDGGALGPAAWGSSLPIDPGEHTVVVSAPGMTPWKTKFTAVEAATQTLTVPPLVPLPASPAPEPSAAPSDSASRSPLRWIGLGVGGAGLLTLGVSGYFALHASNLNSESKEDGHCTPDNACDAVGGEKRDDAKSAANIATGTLIAGGVLTAAGAVMFIVGSSRKHEATSARVEAVPLIGPRQLAFAVRGRF